MKIIFYNVTILAGGIEKSIETLLENLYNEYEVEIVYTDLAKLDKNIVENLRKYAYVHELTEEIKCDVCIWCRLYFDYAEIKPMIIANKYISWIHSEPRALPNCLLDNKQFIKDTSEFICVSKTVKNSLNIYKEGKIIYNFVTNKIMDLANAKKIERQADTLNLVVVSRLSVGKGFERLYELVRELEEKEIPYKLQIIGNGRKMEEQIHLMFAEYKRVEFLGYQNNPYPYINEADYLLQLSDYETFGMTIAEAKILGVPSIITNFESSKEQIEHNVNGIILPLWEKTYYAYLDLMIKNKAIYKENLKSFSYTNDVLKWRAILSKEDRKLEQ